MTENQSGFSYFQPQNFGLAFSTLTKLFFILPHRISKQKEYVSAVTFNLNKP
jgi:hypothetical protein